MPKVCSAGCSAHGAMSWICPRCLQPVFFGEAGTEEGEEKTGRVGAVGFHKYPRRWRNCGSSPLGRRALWRDGAGLPETLPIVSRNPGGWDPGKKGVHLLPGLAPRCLVQPCPPTAEKVSSLGKNWHRFCLKCEHCHNVLSPGGHAEVRLGWVAQPCACHQLPVSAASAHHHQPRQPTPQIELPTRHHTIQYLGSLSCAGGSHAFCQVGKRSSSAS